MSEEKTGQCAPKLTLKLFFLKVVEGLLYTVVGVFAAGFLPGVAGDRPLVLLVSGGILGLVTYLNLVLLKFLKEKINTIGSYTIVSISYIIIILVFILVSGEFTLQAVTSGLTIGLLMPLVLLILSLPGVFLKKTYFFIKLKKYQKIFLIIKNIQNKIFKKPEKINKNKTKTNTTTKKKISKKRRKSKN